MVRDASTLAIHRSTTHIFGHTSTSHTLSKWSSTWLQEAVVPYVTTAGTEPAKKVFRYQTKKAWTWHFSKICSETLTMLVQALAIIINLGLNCTQWVGPGCPRPALWFSLPCQLTTHAPCHPVNLQLGKVRSKFQQLINSWWNTMLINLGVRDNTHTQTQTMMVSFSVKYIVCDYYKPS